MRTLRLGRTFDAVVVHDAIMYMTSEDDLRAAMATAFVHTRAGGAAVFQPDCVRETLRPETDHGGHDGEAGRCATSSGRGIPIPVTRPSSPTTRTCCGTPTASREPCTTGTCWACSRARTWLRLLGEVGFAADAVVDPWGREVFVGVRPSEAEPSIERRGGY